MSIKIQLNSLEAIERLIGGDNEVELELRQWVVQAFASKHLKILSQAQLDKLDTFARKVVEDLVAEKIGKMYYGNWASSHSGFKFVPEIQTAITESIKKQIDELINVKVNDALHKGTKSLDTLIEEKLKTKTYNFIRVKIEEGIHERLNKISKELAG